MSFDQKKLWDKLHSEDHVSEHLGNPSDFAGEIANLLPLNSSILELGCGVGNDALFLSKSGFRVLATDFSQKAIKENRQRYPKINNLRFSVLDINHDFPYPDEKFDCVYARLSLHYFTDFKTKKIFKEISRILKPRALFCFICKSTKDPLYQKGIKIQPDMYDLEGHIRHFFSEDYARALLKNDFSIEKIESGFQLFYGQRSGFIKVIARKLSFNKN